VGGAGYGVATGESHVQLGDRPGKRTVLLPDVAFYRADSMRALNPKDRRLPNVPPDVAVEVRSPNDRPGFREEKIQRYLAWECPLVFDVDPTARIVVVHSQITVRTLTERFDDPVVPWLAFDARELFARLDLVGL
jgi:Uma2 family endonuclease